MSFYPEDIVVFRNADPHALCADKKANDVIREQA